MAQPPRYDRNKDFAEDYADSTDHVALNAEFDGVSLSINKTRANLALLQRDDGALKNGIVTADSLNAGLLGEIVVAVSGDIDDKVQQATAAATDSVNASINSQNSATNSQSYAEQALASAGTAQANAQASNTNKNAAAASEAAAALSEASALSSKNAAAASETASALSETNAGNSAAAAAASAASVLDAEANSAASAAAALVSENAAAGSKDAAEAAAAAAEAVGVLGIADQPETDAGLNDTKAITPKKLWNWVKQATESLLGMAKIATQVQTDAGADDATIVTPKKLQAWVKQATEAALGMAKVATQEEVEEGADDTKFVTALKLMLDFSWVFGPTGYIRFPRWAKGFLIQWGVQNTGSSGVESSNFPLTFSTRFWAGAMIESGIGATSIVTVRVISYELQRISVQKNYANSGDMTVGDATQAWSWLAIGVQ